MHWQIVVSAYLGKKKKKRLLPVYLLIYLWNKKACWTQITGLRIKSFMLPLKTRADTEQLMWSFKLAVPVTDRVALSDL